VTSKPFETVVADANVLLSAVIGKAALRVFLEASFTIATTAFNVAEVREYIPQLSAQYELIPEAVEAQLAMLPLMVYSERSYRTRLPDAVHLMRERDPDDVHLLALALVLGAPIWSNDTDFKGLPIEVITTAQLLRRLARDK